MSRIVRFQCTGEKENSCPTVCWFNLSTSIMSTARILQCVPMCPNTLICLLLCGSRCKWVWPTLKALYPQLHEHHWELPLLLWPRLLLKPGPENLYQWVDHRTSPFLENTVRTDLKKSGTCVCVFVYITVHYSLSFPTPKNSSVNPHAGGSLALNQKPLIICLLNHGKSL